MNEVYNELDPNYWKQVEIFMWQVLKHLTVMEAF